MGRRRMQRMGLAGAIASMAVGCNGILGIQVLPADDSGPDATVAPSSEGGGAGQTGAAADAAPGADADARSESDSRVDSAVPSADAGSDATADTSIATLDAGLDVDASAPFDGTIPPDADDSGSGDASEPRDAHDASEPIDTGTDSAVPIPTDLTWAQWPIPNSPTDVSGGAPHAQSYLVGSGASAGTVIDEVTGLLWQQTPVGSDGGTFPTFMLAGAPGYCAGLSLDGYTDWRLPTVIELLSIVDYSGASSGPFINTTAFPGTPATDFWTSTPPGLAGNGLEVRFENGGSGTTAPSSADAVRCVRGGGAGPFTAVPGPPPVTRYQTSGSGASATVTDTKTQLTWQQTPELDGGAFPTVTYSNALAYCASLGTPWRLPTVNELISLTEYAETTNGGSAASLDLAVFPGTPRGGFWSSTALAGSPGLAWTEDSGEGQGIPSADVTPAYVRCVR